MYFIHLFIDKKILIKKYNIYISSFPLYATSVITALFSCYGYTEILCLTLIIVLQYSETNTFSVLRENQDSVCCLYLDEQFLFSSIKAILKQSFLIRSWLSKDELVFSEIPWAEQLHESKSSDLEMDKNQINLMYYVLDFLQ